MNLASMINSRKLHIAAIACVFLMLAYILRIYFITIGSNYSPNISMSFLSSNYQDLIDQTVLTNTKFQCVKTKVLLAKYSSTVCVHEVKQDRDVSRLLVTDGIWEEHLVTRFVRILSTYRDLAFFDIGANLGVYTMYAASLGCPTVISVECYRPNIDRIRRAVELEHVQQRVILVPYALYSRSGVYLSLRSNIANNIGSQRLNNEVARNDQDPLVVKTIRFDDLLPIIHRRNIREAIVKIDIETSEHFLCETGEQTFDQVNIVLVMMEWALIKNIAERASLIVRFFTDRHYIAFNSQTCQAQVHQMNYTKWETQDIYWIKQNYTHLCEL